MHYFLLYILVGGAMSVYASSPCLAQSSTTLMGARGQAMGNATACLSDSWSMLNNVAGIAKASASSLAVSYDAFPALPAFGKMALAAGFPGTLACGVALYRFGDEVYNEQAIAAGAATRWKHTSVGLKMNCICYSATGLGSKVMWTISAGGITALTPWLTVGAHITNINQPWLSRQTDERLPTTLNAGLMFSLAPDVIAVTEVEKRVNEVATCRAGLEFALHKKVFARIGLQLNPQSLSGGLGFHLRKIQLDYSMQYVQAWGTRHQASCIIAFRQKDKVHQPK